MSRRRRISSRRSRRFRWQALLPWAKRIVVVVAVCVAIAVLLMLALPNTFRYLRQQVRRALGVDSPVTTLRYNGIDVSHHQGRIDWDVVAGDSNLKFVYVKATEGATHTDRYYDRNFRGAKKAGLKVGSYHYFTSRRSARRQAANFISHCDKDAQDLLPMVDVEGAGVKGWTDRQVRDSLWVFAELIRHHYGRYPMIYSYAKFYNSVLSPHFNRFYLFIAKYSPDQPVVKGAGSHNVWQLTDSGRIDGIKGRVDLDVLADGTTLSDLMLHH